MNEEQQQQQMDTTAGRSYMVFEAPVRPVRAVITIQKYDDGYTVSMMGGVARRFETWSQVIGWLAALWEDKPKQTAMQRLLQAVSAYYGITVAQLQGTDKHANHVHARATAMYIARSKLKLSYPVIGAEFHKHHTTVMNAVRRVEKLMESDPAYQAEVAEVEHRIEQADS